MPAGPFKDLWSTLERGSSWMGMLKNKNKQGQAFWVDAYIIPIIEQGKIVEYQCIYRRPNQEVITRADNIYKLRKQGKSPRELNRPNLNLSWRLSIALAFSILPVFVAVLANLSQTNSLIMIGITFALALLSSHALTRQLNYQVEQSRKLVNHQVKQLIYTGTTDDVGQLQLVQTLLQSQLNAILCRIKQASSEVEKSAIESTDVMNNTCSEMLQQQRSLHELSDAMEQVTETTGEVAQRTSAALQQVQQAQFDANNGAQVVHQAVNTMLELDRAIDQIDNNIENLKQRSDAIGKVVTVINEIAEQTNLLALNAAIEAARAGENGRGFAVVADEVRQLAQRTQISTQEISDMISSLQQETNIIAHSMVKGRKLTDQTVTGIQEAGHSLQAIMQAIETLSGLAAQIATATEQQNSVSIDMNQQIHEISQSSENVVNQANQIFLDFSAPSPICSIAEHLKTFLYRRPPLSLCLERIKILFV